MRIQCLSRGVAASAASAERLLRAYGLAPPACHTPAAKSRLSDVRVSPAIRPEERETRRDILVGRQIRRFVCPILSGLDIMVLYARSPGSLARSRIQDKGRCVKHFKLSVPTTESINARSWLARECRLRLGCIKGEGGASRTARPGSVRSDIVPHQTDYRVQNGRWRDPEKRSRRENANETLRTMNYIEKRWPAAPRIISLPFFLACCSGVRRRFSRYDAGDGASLDRRDTQNKEPNGNTVDHRPIAYAQLGGSTPNPDAMP